MQSRNPNPFSSFVALPARGGNRYTARRVHVPAWSRRMSTDLPRPLLRLAYGRAADEYLRSLPPEHFMEATPQARQREITVESLALLKAQRADVQYFNELLVQYPFGRARDVHQVVPDNMVVLSDALIVATGSYDVPLQPVRPFWTLEYVSKSSKRKDYEDSFHKYERELKVPYSLVFYPETQDLTLFHLRGRRYPRSAPMPSGGIRSQNWRWKWRCKTAGRASGIRDSCCPCRLTCSATWRTPAASCTRNGSGPTRSGNGPNGCSPSCAHSGSTRRNRTQPVPPRSRLRGGNRSASGSTTSSRSAVPSSRSPALDRPASIPSRCG